MGTPKGRYPDEPGESEFAGFRGPRGRYLEEAEPARATAFAEKGPAECGGGCFGGVYFDGSAPKEDALVCLDPEDATREIDPEDATREIAPLAAIALDGSAPKDDALVCLDLEDATREIAPLAAAAPDDSALEGPPIGGLASKTDAL
ncbi:hypothetical protein ACQKWADRAFT_316491 [Trichoderma austrokoningii]